MPAVLGMRGFGGKNTDADRLIVLAGTATYDTSNVPAGGSNVSIGGSGLEFRAPWYDDPAADVFEPTSGDSAFHCNYYTNINNTNNDGLLLGFGSAGDEFVCVSAEDNTNKLTIRVAGVVRATALTEAFSLATWKRVHIVATGWSAGDTISVYTDGDLSAAVVSYTLTGTDQTNLQAAGTSEPNEFRIKHKSGDSTGRVDNLGAYDLNDADFPGLQFIGEISIEEQTVTGNGAETDWSGDVTDIDEQPYNDADKITAGAVGDESSFTTGATSGDNVFAVRACARVTRTGTTAGSNLTVRTNNGTDTEDLTMAAPADGHVEATFQQAPDGTAWSPVKRDAVRIGFEAVT